MVTQSCCFFFSFSPLPLPSLQPVPHLCLVNSSSSHSSFPWTAPFLILTHHSGLFPNACPFYAISLLYSLNLVRVWKSCDLIFCLFISITALINDFLWLSQSHPLIISQPKLLDLCSLAVIKNPHQFSWKYGLPPLLYVNSQPLSWGPRCSVGGGRRPSSFTPLGRRWEKKTEELSRVLLGFWPQLGCLSWLLLVPLVKTGFIFI